MAPERAEVETVVVTGVETVEVVKAVARVVVAKEEVAMAVGTAAVTVEVVTAVVAKAVEMEAAAMAVEVMEAVARGVED